MKRKHVIVLLVVLFLLLGAGGGAWLLWQRRKNSKAYRLGTLQGEIAIQLRLGDRAKAAELLERYLEIDPDDRDRALTLANLYASLGRADETEAFLRALLVRHPGDLKVVLALAQDLFAKQRLAESWELIEPHLEPAQEHADTKARTDLWILGGRLHARLGRVEEGLKLLREAAKQRESFGVRQLDTGDQRVAALLAEGQVLLGAGRAKEAEAVLRKAYGIAEDAISVCQLLSDLLRRKGKRDEGLEILRKLYDLRSDAPQAVAPLLADYLVEVGRRKEALALAEQLDTKDERGQGVAAYVRGILAQRQGHASEALKHFRAMARLLPASSRAHLMMAGQAMAVGDLQLARSALEQTLALDPGSVGAEVGLLELEERLHDDAAARTRALRLLGVSPARPRALKTLLSLYRRDPEGIAGAVRARLRAVLKATPRDVTAQLYLAVFQLLGGEVEAGAKALARLAGAPTVDLQRSLGLIAAAQAGSTDLLEAVELLSGIAEQDPKLAPAREVLAILYERLGRQDLARRELEAALAVRVTPAATAARARLALLDPKPERAAQELEALLAKAPKDTNLLRALAILALNAEDVPRARGFAKRAVAQAPRDAGLQALHGRLLILAGEAAEGRTAYATARRLAPKYSGGYEDGLQLLLSGDPVTARKRLADGLRLTGDPRLAAGLAAVLAERNRTGEALQVLGRLRRPTPEVLLMRIHLLHLAGDLPAANRLAERAPISPEVIAAMRALDVDRRPRVYRLFALKIMRWRLELQRLARELPDEVRDPCLLWWSLRAFPPQQPEFLRFAKRLAGVAKRGPNPGLALADAQLQAKQTADEVQTLRALAGRFPEDGRVALRLGMSLERDGQLEEAITQYAKAVERSRGLTQAIAHNNLAYQLASSPERRARAIEHGEAAARLAPRSGRIQDTLGWVLFRAGRLDEAERHLARAVSLEPANPTLRYHLAALLERKGERQRALGHLRAALLSRAEFSARSRAEALQGRLKSESATLAKRAQAPRLARGAEHTGTIGPEGVAAVHLAGGGEVTFAFKGSPETKLALFEEQALRLRLQAGPDGARVVPRLRTPPGGLVLLVWGEPQASFLVRLAPSKPEADDVEPNDAPADAQQLATGKAFLGSFHGPADRDLVRLQLPPGKASLTLEAKGQAARLQLIRAHPSGDEVLKAFEVPAGQRRRLGPLREDRREGWMVRLSPVGQGGGYALSVAGEDLAGDPEPNDRPEDAIPGPVKTTLSGRLGPSDVVDWHRLTGDPASSVVQIEAAGASGGSGLVLRLWERSPARLNPVKVYSFGQERLIVERWRLRVGAELLLEVRAQAPPERELDYTLTVQPAADSADAETEPNDRAADAEAVTKRLRGTLVASDVDWLLPAKLPGKHFGFELTWKQGPVRVNVFGVRGRQLLSSGSFEGRGGKLSVPCVALPEGRLRLALQSRSGAGAYELKLTAASAAKGREVEPNDDLIRASTLHAELGLAGELNGSSDRDLVRVQSARALTVEATGEAPLRVQLTQGGASPVRIEPKTSHTFAARELSQAAPYLELTRPEGTSGVASYQLTQKP